MSTLRLNYFYICHINTKPSQCEVHTIKAHPHPCVALTLSQPLSHSRTHTLFHPHEHDAGAYIEFALEHVSMHGSDR